MMEMPSNLSNTIVRGDRRPRQSNSTYNGFEQAAAPFVPPAEVFTHRGRCRGVVVARNGGFNSHGPSSVRHNHPPRVGQRFPNPPPPIQAPPPPPIVRCATSIPQQRPRNHAPASLFVVSSSAFQLHPLTGGKSRAAARSTDPAKGSHSTTAEDSGRIADFKSRNVTSKAWATTAATATITDVETNQKQLSAASSTAANQGKVEPSHPPPPRPESQPLPLMPSDTNLPPAPPTSSPQPSPPPIHKPLRPQRPQRSRGCGGVSTVSTTTTTTVTTTSKPRDDDIKAQTGTASDLSVSPVTVLVEPTASDGCSKSSTAEESEGPVNPPVEPEETGSCRRPLASPLPAMPERVDDKSHPARTRARARNRPPASVPLAIFCNSCEPSGSSSLRVSIVPTHDNVPLTARDYAALIGHVTAHSNGADDAAAQKAECILVDALDRQLMKTQRHRVV